MVGAVNKVRHDASASQATIDEFTSTMKSGVGRVLLLAALIS